MKQLKSTRLASIIAITVAVALLAFLCIYPAIRSNRITNTLINKANLCFEYIRTGNSTGLAEVLDDINSRLETDSDFLRLFYSHDDIAELENAVHRAVRIVTVVDDDMEVLISSICEIIESAELIKEREDIGWGAFI